MRRFSFWRRYCWINLYDYNYRHYHKSLRLPVVGQKTLWFNKRWSYRTPAMAMGATQEALIWRLLFLASILGNSLIINKLHCFVETTYLYFSILLLLKYTKPLLMVWLFRSTQTIKPFV